MRAGRMKNEEDQVIQFFRTIASDYDRRYHDGDPLLSYFFVQRLERSTHGINFNGKSVLDIGSGTGALYDYLSRRYRISDFYACDICEEMMRQSRVPRDCRFVGKAYEIRFPIDSFDYIYMLGVSTYMTLIELKTNIEFIKAKLKNDGMAVISFTNRGSLDHAARMIARPFFKAAGGKRNVLTQPFRLHAYTTRAVKRLVGHEFITVRTSYLNQTLFPVSLLFKRSAVRVARFIERHATNDRVMAIFSSDFVVFLQPRSPTTLLKDEEIPHCLARQATPGAV